MGILVTGAAGFIGYHVARRLLERGERVHGVDSLNSYYDPALKRARLEQLQPFDQFAFTRLDIAEEGSVQSLLDHETDIDRVIHLAAQAGVRYSLDAPLAYVDANVRGQTVILEVCRHLERVRHIVYASSSSIYGGSQQIPFHENERADDPLSVYAASKRAAELLANAYAHLYRMPLTGLRFFSVYGPWGRPDMAAFLFTSAILEGRPIELFNAGDLRRDFTYIDDVVDGVVAALDRPPAPEAPGIPHRIYNLGNHRCEPLMRFVEVIEEACGRRAERRSCGMQPGDVKETYADVTAAQRDLGFEPSTPIDVGLPRFVAWYRQHYEV